MTIISHLTFPLSWLWMYVRMRRGIFTSVIMKEPLARVPRWQRTVRAMEERIGVIGIWDLFLNISRPNNQDMLEMTNTSVVNDNPHENHCFLPGEIVGDDGTGDSHLLEGENELTDPNKTHSVIPHHILKRFRHVVLHHTCDVVLYRCSCVERTQV